MRVNAYNRLLLTWPPRPISSLGRLRSMWATSSVFAAGKSKNVQVRTYATEVLDASATAVALIGGRPCGPRAADRSPRLIRATPAVLGGNEVSSAISAPIHNLRCLGRDPRFRGWRLPGRRRRFHECHQQLRLLTAAATHQGAGGAGYAPGIRRPFCWLSWSTQHPPSGTCRTGTK